MTGAAAATDDRPGIDPDYLSYLAAIAPRAPAKGPPDVAGMRVGAAASRLAWQAGGAVMDAVVEETLPTARGPVRIRVYHPRPERPSPAFVYLHGGGWVLFDLDTHDRAMREWAAATGHAVVGVDYPRAPETRFPGTVHACAAVVEALRRAAPRLGLAAPWTLAGDSAGANLALAATLAARDAGAPMADALVLAYGVYDGTTERPSHAAFSAPPLTLTRDRMAWFWDQYCPDPDARADPLASPLRADLRGLPPARLITSGRDVLRDENLAMAVRLAEAGNAVSLDHHPAAPHGFLEAVALTPKVGATIAAAAAWLRAATGKAAPA